jgi:hypothetical protein
VKQQTTDRYQCSHLPFGCGRGVEWTAFHRPAGLCTGCAQKAARTLRVTLADLATALSAYQAASAGRPNQEPTTDEVWAVLERFNALLPPNLRVVKQDQHIPVPPPMRHPPADSCLPDGDRLEVAA